MKIEEYCKCGCKRKVEIQVDDDLKSKKAYHLIVHDRDAGAILGLILSKEQIKSLFNGVIEDKF